MPDAQPLSEVEQSIADKILHILDLFPKISPSMLQISLGSGMPTAIWRPVLDKLSAESRIFIYKRTTQSPAKRSQVITIISKHPDDTPQEQ